MVCLVAVTTAAESSVRRISCFQATTFKFTLSKGLLVYQGNWLLVSGGMNDFLCSALPRLEVSIITCQSFLCKASLRECIVELPEDPEQKLEVSGQNGAPLLDHLVAGG